MANSKQLYENKNGEFQELFPFIRIEDIKDEEDKRLLSLINKFNHIYLGTFSNKNDARLIVPNLFRRYGIWISYNYNGDFYTEKYIGPNINIEDDNIWTNDNNWEIIPDVNYVNDASLRIPANSITLEQLSKSIIDLLANGNTIINLADDEDLQENECHVIKFKDRKYSPVLASGKGYKILRKNWVNGKNVLTQEMINEHNTVYGIRYDFDLNEQEITIPENCVLKFNGGSLSNGIIISNNCIIDGNFIFNNIQIDGNYKTNKKISKSVYSTLQDLINDDYIEYDILVETLGYYNEYDGGAATYKVVETTDNTVDTGSCIRLNKGYAILIPYNGEINAKQFGAISISNNAESVTDSTVNIQNAIDYIQNNTNTKKLFINGFFAVKELTIDTNNQYIEIYGTCNLQKQGFLYIGENGYIDNFDEDSNQAIITIKSIGVNIHHLFFQGIANSSIANLKFVNSMAYCAIYVDSYLGPNTCIHDCNFNFFADSAIHTDSSLYGYLYNLEFLTSGRSAIHIDSCISFSINNFAFDTNIHNYIYYNDKYKSIISSLKWFSNTYRFGNTFLHIGTLDTANIVEINCARMEGSNLVDYDDMTSSLVVIDNIRGAETNKPSIRISNINAAVKFKSYIYSNNNNMVRLSIDNVQTSFNVGIYNSGKYYNNRNSSDMNWNNLSFIENIRTNKQSFKTDHFRSTTTNNNETRNSSDVINPTYFTHNISTANGYFTFGDTVKLYYRKYSDTTVSRYGNEYVCIYPKIGYGYKKTSNSSLNIDEYKGVINSSNSIITSTELHIGGTYNINDEINTVIHIINVGSKYECYFIKDFDNLELNEEVSGQLVECKFALKNVFHPLNVVGNTENRPSEDLLSGMRYLDTTLNRPIWWNGKVWIDSNGYYANNIKGNSTQRPTPQSTDMGFEYYDSTIKKKILWNGTKWVDFSGNDADIVNTGTFEQKPDNPSKGFAYFCTDKQTTEGAANGIMIYHKGNNVWVDALGRIVS